MKLSQTLPARLRASAIHFGLSLVVFLILLGDYRLHLVPQCAVLD
ncbi:hypothetical protein MNBD_GAMMA18-1538 [hydrothermal vent metagenome]|uniref:Uncharacterized protein n=1 Tax=hydrothermal vent metagenome TaxID=652676 RepID=A0A3B1AAB2_9ZZZZ